MNPLLLHSNMYCLFIFIVILTGGNLTNLFPCNFQDLLYNNIITKHIFAFFTLLLFVILTTSEIIAEDLPSIAITTIFLYFIFTLITKCHIHLFFMILFLLGITYIISIIKTRQFHKNKDKPILENLSIYNNVEYVLYILILILIIVGVTINIGEKKLEYNKNFSYITFFIGKTICKNNKKTHTIINSLKNAFN